MKKPINAAGCTPEVMIDDAMTENETFLSSASSSRVWPGRSGERLSPHCASFIALMGRSSGVCRLVRTAGARTIVAHHAQEPIDIDRL
jgi:hypothetical protein